MYIDYSQCVQILRMNFQYIAQCITSITSYWTSLCHIQGAAILNILDGVHVGIVYLLLETLVWQEMCTILTTVEPAGVLYNCGYK